MAILLNIFLCIFKRNNCIIHQIILVLECYHCEYFQLTDKAAKKFQDILKTF